ncbi:uncharacterized protein Dsimw501_GD27849 [Drosophila simulans]|nr:uncharacterized protein Dsimw501_GD27849 [Drosophila simulans]
MQSGSSRRVWGRIRDSSWTPETCEDAEDQHAWAWALAYVCLAVHSAGQRHVHLNLQLLEGQLDCDWKWE